MTVTDAFAGFPTRTDRITSQANGYTSYNGNAWKGSLTTLQPGQGYIYNSAATETKTFTYPTTSKAAQTSVKPVSLSIAKKQVAKTVSMDAKKRNGNLEINKRIRK
jgi:hypothetical protein